MLREVTACANFGKYAFGDSRLWRRFLRIREGIRQTMHSLLTNCFESKADREGAYRFFSNKKVSPSAILLAEQPQLLTRLSKCVNDILIIQDSMTLSYPTHPCTKNLGKVGCNKTPGRGIITHNSLAIDAESNVALGLSHQSYFHHDEFVPDPKRAIEEKESYRWLQHLRHNHSLCPQAIHICDREGDIFEFLQEAHNLKAFFIVRQSQDRSIGTTMHGKKEGKILDRLDCTPSIGSYTEVIQNEDVTLEVKFIDVNIAPTRRTAKQRGARDYQAIPLTVVQVSGMHSNGHKITWNLLTNLPVNDFETCQKVVRYYAKRWQIELFHKALKTGFALEEARLEDGVKLTKLIAIISIEAAFAYALLYAARQTITPALTEFLSQSEVEAMTFLMKVKQPPGLQAVIEFIGAAGGFVKTKKYPYPGILTFFRGWHIVRHKIKAVQDVWYR
jgi:hypothetical protein